MRAYSWLVSRFGQAVRSSNVKLATSWPHIPSLGHPVLVRGFFLFSPTKTQARAMVRTLSLRKVNWYRSLFECLEPRDEVCVVDVGANIAYSAMAFFDASRSLPNSGDWSFLLVEPNFHNFPYIQRNMSAWSRRFGDIRWKLLPLAMGKGAGFLEGGIPTEYELRPGDGKRNSGLFSFSASLPKINGSTLSLPVLASDELFSFVDAASISFLKLDVEGGELDFLRATASVLFQNRTVVEMETNPLFFRQSEYQELEKLQVAHDYVSLSSTRYEPGKRGDLILAPRDLGQRLLRPLGLKILD